MGDKIIVLGCPGSGKSTLSKAMSQRLDLPLVHLDRLYWRPGWKNVTNEEFDGLLETELLKEAWIMDGNYKRTLLRRLAACDIAIYLDFPRWVCLLGVIGRVIKNYGRTRDDLGDNCPERFDLSFLKWVWDYKKSQRPRCMAMLTAAGPDQQVYILRSRKELPELLEKLEQQRRI